MEDEIPDIEFEEKKELSSENVEHVEKVDPATVTTLTLA